MSKNPHKTHYEETMQEILDIYNDRDLCDTAEKREVARKWAVYYAHVFLGEGYKIHRPDEEEKDV